MRSTSESHQPTDQEARKNLDDGVRLNSSEVRQLLEQYAPYLLKRGL